MQWFPEINDVIVSPRLTLQKAQGQVQNRILEWEEIQYVAEGQFSWGDGCQYSGVKLEPKSLITFYPQTL